MVKKINCILIILIFMINLLLPIISVANDELITIKFEDQSLYNGISRMLANKINSKDDNNLTITMTKENVESVEILNLENIENLNGLENFKNLSELTIQKCEIVDISALSNLTNLTILFLSNNNIEDISVLSNLINLTILSLSNNNIEDINVLSNLTNLTHLELNDNNIKDITALGNLTNLTTLFLSNNNIEDISVLSNLTNLTRLVLSDNNIDDASILSSLTNLTSLELSDSNIDDVSILSSLTNLEALSLANNNIEDITPLGNLTNLEYLHLNDNNIKDISVLSNLTKLKLSDLSHNNISDLSLIENSSVLYTIYGQTITILTKESEIELPKIFKQAQDKNSKLYTEEEFTLENCTLNETKDKVILNDGTEEATVTINGGELSAVVNSKSKLYIKLDKISPELEVTYDNTNLTNKPVTATITANEEIQELEGWTLGKDKKTLTKEYTQNINETVTVKDIAGNESKIDVKISNIDLEAPKLEIKYDTTNPTKENVIATIESDEEIQEVEGWTLGEDRRTLTKEYRENIGEMVTVKDIAGNETKINVNIGNIDREKPKVEVSYSTKEETQGPVTVTIKANEEIEEVEGWELSKDRKTLTKEYSENTNEEITIRDLAGNEEKAIVSIGNVNIGELKLNIKYSTTKKTNENVIVTIEANEEIKEVEGWQLGEDRKTLTKTYTGNTKETVEIEDMLGYKTKKEIEITNIDKIKPKVSVKYSTTAMTNKNIIVTLTADEEIQVTEGWQLGEDGKTLTKTYAKNIEEEVIVKDIAGNEEKVIVEITNIDLKAPEVQISYSTTTKTDTPVTVTIKTDEEIQEVEGWKLSEDRKTLTKVYSTNGEETITITDLVGNSREVRVNVSNIVKSEQNTGNNNNNTSGIVNNGVADKELPKAGGNIILITIIGTIILIAIILKIKLKKYKDVK